jgi:methyltransferase (TIGR00027 family)
LSLYEELRPKRHLQIAVADLGLRLPEREGGTIMQEGKSSLMAEVAAAYRAAESLKPEDERICYDPLAKNFLRPSFRLIASSRLLSDIVLWYASERKYPGSQSVTVARVRYIDDYLTTCIADGIKQLVVLGAGYDSRAYRIGGLKGKVRVFEVDHPITQRVKMDRVKKMLGSLPDHVVYVPIDFDKEKLDRRLFESGYDSNLKTLFIWEGVTVYLTAEAVDETLAFVVNNSGQGSAIIFNYIYQSVVDGTYEMEAARKHQAILTRLGEPFTFGIEEGKIEEFLSNRGFCQIRNASPEFLETTYFTGANQGRKVCPYIPTVHATVKPRG